MAKIKSSPLQVALQERAALKAQMQELKQAIAQTITRLESCETAKGRAEAAANEIKQHYLDYERNTDWQRNEAEAGQRSKQCEGLGAELSALEDKVSAIAERLRQEKNSRVLLLAGLADCDSVGLDIANLEKLASESGARLATLEATADLGSEAAIGEIVKLQAMSALLPRRITARSEDLCQVRASVLEFAHLFVQSDLMPKLRGLGEKADAKVRAALKPHFTESLELDRAVAKSALMEDLRGISSGVSIRNVPTDEIVDYAQKLLTADRLADAFAAKL